MKTYQSVKEGEWHEIKNVPLNEEEKMLLFSTNSMDLDEKKTLITKIKNESKHNVEHNLIIKLNKIYNEIKPILKEGDDYKLIHFIIHENDLKRSGILNCLLKGKHLQIRF